MTAKLYGHPFSAYCQKALIAFDERGFSHDFVLLAFDDTAAQVEFGALWPIRRMPVLVADGRTLMESTIIVEHADLAAGAGPRLIPADPRAALETRMLDRIFDNYVMTPMQKLVFDRLRDPARRDAQGVEEARALLDKSYRWLDGALADRDWAAGETFSLADCAAAPALFYADWVHPIDACFATLRAYRARLLARPSVARVVDAARPYRPLFPGGAPDRD